ncbi:MAG: hypothetical protein DI603_20665 [Roseateles depolymerans]|uniref:Uncharacterized protein n=1 Tax=Roseateles depolymerans TaxID=76731 RepID=A0A2W5DHR9_9BURK|nr:MAG: hypothetical protein DI603_20665 [Roseateles depolymerans]
MARGLAWLLDAPRWAGWRRRLLAGLPFPVLASEVSDVAYLTWMVPVSRVAAWVPPGLALVEHQGLTPFTVLSYAHRHFGPAALGRLRRLCPSPLQSNWRLYLRPQADRQVPERTVLFTHNAISQLPYVLGARLFSDGLPVHLPRRFSHGWADGLLHTDIDPGAGSAPALRASLQLLDDAALSGADAVLQACGPGWAAAVRRLTLQDAAVVPLPEGPGCALVDIALPIDPAQVRPARLRPGSLHCPVLQALQPQGGPLCFVVPAVDFQVLRERLI